MKRILFLSLCLLIVTTAAFGATKGSKEVPKTAAPVNAVATITMDARSVAAGRGVAEAAKSGGTLTTTTHSGALQITLGNVGTSPATVTVHWFWVGRYEKSKTGFAPPMAHDDGRQG